MKAFGILLLVLILSLLSTVQAGESGFAACPILSAGETVLDCPWAMITRDLENETNPAKVARRLEAIAPDYIERLTREGSHARKVRHLWGRSINFDENAKAVIVPEAIIDVILHYAGVPPREGRAVHAGFEHTYGYLLSNLKTPYGYKRLRWVRPDIERGFRLEKGSLSPRPKDGGLLMNLSAFAGRIAFRGNRPSERAAIGILREGSGIARSIRHFNYRKLHGRRLTETVELEGGRTVELRTDFIPFTDASGVATGGNAELLIYSIHDSAAPLPHLISAFPIAPGFSDGALNPKNLGEGKPVITRYNAFVPGFTDARIPRTGKREASAF